EPSCRPWWSPYPFSCSFRRVIAAEPVLHFRNHAIDPAFLGLCLAAFAPGSKDFQTLVIAEAAIPQHVVGRAIDARGMLFDVFKQLFLGHADLRSASDPAEQRQHQNNHQHQSQRAGRVIAPTAAMRPCRPGAQQQNEKHDNQNGSKHGNIPFPNLKRNSVTGWRFPSTGRFPGFPVRPYGTFERAASFSLGDSSGAFAKEKLMKTILPVLTSAAIVLLAGPALAGQSTPKEIEITKQLNLEQAQQAKNTNQQIAANMPSTNTQAQSAPAAAPSTPA